MEPYTIDAQRWPGVARVPTGPLSGPRETLARRSFERACVRGGVDLQIRDQALYQRLAESDWVGLGESYLAGEWVSETLPETLAGLLEAGVEPGMEGRVGRSLRRVTRTRPELADVTPGGELPSSLVALFAGKSLAAGPARFASGIATTVREDLAVEAGGTRRREVSRPPIDVTTVDPPVDPVRADLPGAQERRIAVMMQTAQVRASSRVLEWPSSGGSLAMAAADRGAAADVVVNSADMAAAVGANIAEAGMQSYVRVLRSRGSIPSAREFPTDYDAILSTERLATLGMAGLLRWVQAADRVLSERGRLVLHLPVAVGDTWDEVGPALDFIRSYIWPALFYPRLPELVHGIERDTGLRVVERTHFPGHYEHTLRIWREVFVAQSRQAAGLGYDRVYRRLWEYYLALQEALVHTGRLDMVQLTLAVAPPRRR